MKEKKPTEEDLQSEQRILEASKEEVFQEEIDEDYEYVEIEDWQQKKNQQLRYLDDSSSNNSQKYIDENRASGYQNSQPKQASTDKFKFEKNNTNRKNNSSLEEPLDVEPLEIEPKKEKEIRRNQNDIEDPW